MHITDSGDMGGCTVRRYRSGRLALISDGQPTVRLMARDVLVWGDKADCRRTYTDTADCIVHHSVFDPMDKVIEELIGVG